MCCVLLQRSVAHMDGKIFSSIYLKVREQLKNLLILFGIVNERIETRAKYLVLKYLRMGIIELEHIANNDMRALARLYLRARRMREEIAELRQSSERRRQRKARALWASA